MAVNGIELEVGQEWLTRGGRKVKVVEVNPNRPWPVVVEATVGDRYTVSIGGYALDACDPRPTDLCQPVSLGIDLPVPPVADPKDSNTVTSAQVNDGEWIEWHGGECPVGPSTPIEVEFAGGNKNLHSQPGDMRWGHCGSNNDIVAYRLVKAPALPDGLAKAFDSLSKALSKALSDTKGIGDIHGTAKGSGARYNTGKPALELIPLWLIAAQFNTVDAQWIDEGRHRAVDALDALGMFQAREGKLSDVLKALGDHWDDCARVFDYGRRKYAAWNWAKGMPWSAPIGCAARHLMAIIRGETTDPESGLPHVGHVFCNIVMLATYQGTYTEGDDRPTKGMLL